MTAQAIAVVGMACEFPDAPSPSRLWENVLAQRRAFRRLPSERLCLEDYWSGDRAAEDRLYATEAAVIEGYEFDRVRFRVPGGAYRAADLTHWLALDVACRALADSGFAEAVGLPRESTGVLVGNTLTGEMTRAESMRLRWPYVRRIADAALRRQEIDPALRRSLLADMEQTYKAPFQPIGDESLAGALSNTIAGRVCNHLDLGGGGYTVDGACAASLLAVLTACERLAVGDLDVAIAGGVDISLDPFELVGFAKAGALATDDMRVYDARSDGFWPGEGCGFVVLMRLADARAADATVHAVVRGWGVSSDGSGGLTRPEPAGQLRALMRAYQRAQLQPGAVAYFEGHGTGTAVGDATELRALLTARRDSGAHPAVIGSVKANIGHTKAAAGVAGFIKCVLAIRDGVIPPTTGCVDPHPELLAANTTLRIARSAEPWPAGDRIAGVSAMGFGGINTHAVLTTDGPVSKRRGLTDRQQLLSASAQDAELFLFAAADATELSRAVTRLGRRAKALSRAQMVDLAHGLATEAGSESVRAAIVATRPAELGERLDLLAGLLQAGAERVVGSPPGVFLGSSERSPRIGYLLPGQGTLASADGGALCRRFPFVRELFAGLGAPPADAADTAFAQPAILANSLAGLRVLAALGVGADVAVGHSLGELTALVWAGAFSEGAGARIATARGKAISEHAEGGGAMAGLGVELSLAEALASGLPLAVAGINAPSQTVLSGPAAAIEAVVGRARARGVTAAPLRVSHAFHSPLMAPAAVALADVLEHEPPNPLVGRVVSTVTGRVLSQADDLGALLCQQLTAPVRFADAVAEAAAGLDLLIEVGPGGVLTGLIGSFVPVPSVAMDAGGPSLVGVLSATAAAWALGATVRAATLVESRFARTLDLDGTPRVFGNPCERVPQSEGGSGHPPATPAGAAASSTPQPSDQPPPRDRLELVRELVAARAELPAGAVSHESRLLDDLHLNSIVVSELAVEAARRLGLPPPVAPNTLATATVAMLADALGEASADAAANGAAEPPGAGPWARAFTVDYVESPLPHRPAAAPPGDWQVIATRGHPMVDALSDALHVRGGRGVALCLPACPQERDLPLFLEAVRALAAPDAPERLLVVQSGGGGGGFARALHLEYTDVATCVVEVPYDARAAEWVADEAAMHRSGFVEARYDGEGRRRTPLLRHLAVDVRSHAPALRDDDVAIVTGGAKGIVAESALAMASGSRAGLAFIGRTDPSADERVRSNLARIEACGARVRYYRADVTDAEALRAAVIDAQHALGTPTVVLHAAGNNEPMLVKDLDERALRATVAPKVAGLRNLLYALDRGSLRLLITFGSVIARTGMRGDAHYALANEWQTLLTERFAATTPHCRCLALESSVWSGVGMGHRLGSVEALARQGVEAMSPDAATALLTGLVGMSSPPVAVVAAGRLGRPQTIRYQHTELPLRRFLERPRVHYADIEVVADAELSADLDPYLRDHVLDGEQVLPAVIGLEAMAQAATALSGAAASLRFDDVRFERPIVVPADEPTTLRVAAIAESPDTGRVVVRSGRTGFQVDHQSARWRLRAPQPAAECLPPPRDVVALERDELYGSMLFQGGRFRRLRRYLALSATECVAELEEPATTNWFGRFMPQDIVAGDPGCRDAALHALQACLPNVRVVPVAVDAVWFNAHTGAGGRIVHARERARGPREFTFDILVTDASGVVVERWLGVRFRAVSQLALSEPWPQPLLATYLERRLAGLDDEFRVAVIADDGHVARRTRSDMAVHRLLAEPVVVRRREDGRPETADRLVVSTAHLNGITLAVAGAAAVACDIEAAVARPRAAWRDLLGGSRSALSETIAADRDEELSEAATRVWAAAECVKKIGLPSSAPLTLAGAADDGWIVLACGDRAVATLITHVRGIDEPVAVAVLGARDARL